MQPYKVALTRDNELLRVEQITRLSSPSPASSPKRWGFGPDAKYVDLQFRFHYVWASNEDEAINRAKGHNIRLLLLDRWDREDGFLISYPNEYTLRESIH